MRPSTVFGIAFAIGVLGQEIAQGQVGYQTPDPALVAIVDASRFPSVRVDPTGEKLLLLQPASHPSIADLAAPELRLAGIRIDPATSGPSRAPYSTSLKLRTLSDISEIDITGIPEGARIRYTGWSPDGSKVAFTVADAGGIRLWIADAATGRAKRLAAMPLNATFGRPYQWLSDSEHFVVRFIPEGRGAAPIESAVPAGPTIQESSGRRAAARTYQDLLKSDFDGELLEHFADSQIAVVSLDGTIAPLHDPAMIGRAEPSPNGEFILVETVERPFSFLVPYYRFARRVEVWAKDGAHKKLIARLPLAEEVPIGRGAVATGPRNFGWRGDTGATLHWVEAQDGGDPRAEAEVRDSVFMLEAPFDDPPRKIADLGYRYAGIRWANDNLALVSERWWSTRQVRTWRVRPSDRNATQELVFEYSSEDRYGDPGVPVMTLNDFGRAVMLTANEGEAIYLTGPGASPEGDRPFLRQFSMDTRETEELWRNEGEVYESFVAAIDPGRGTFLTRRESPSEPPNYFLRNTEGTRFDRITSFPHPYPEMANVYKKVLRYTRDDGTELQGTLYLPPGKKPEDGPWPMLMWAYPREYKDAKAAGQMRGSPYRFNAISPRGPLPFLTVGYAILDGPTMPIIGEGDVEPNDGFVEQLVASARAAIDEVVRLGVAERDRIAVGGHSYGAFMTANLLAHSDLFAAGIARSGAYNRTLTPFGFQAEERTFWESPDVYFAMSPFMHADKVDEPILMIHGEADNNSGTFPLQSRRYYNALKGHGAKARLVMLPHESHGYTARESLLHMLYEEHTWLDKYVKHYPE